MTKLEFTQSNTHTLAERLNRLMREHGVTTAQLAKSTGIAVGTINRMSNDKTCNPTISSLKPVCDFFSITVSQMIGEDELRNFQKVATKWLNVPIIHWKELNCHLNTDNTNTTLISDNSEKETKEKEQIKINSEFSSSSFATRMPDDSMTPFFPKESVLIFDPEQTINDRSYVLVYLHRHNSYVFKQLIIDKPYQYLKSAHSELGSYLQLQKNDKIIAPLVQSKINF
ncbi:hypothetical protein AVI51_06370 [Piscirickettsia salmonis]|uniref:HTH-type transcriptional regulator n=1 Tax=Piscirickettsia salmonis TaxID=1238 RepID=A0A9Q5VCN0_PISSA|nr:helix-turn-helix domain-containing protein [Piscirickettsia salmonis]RNC77676.1 peptidase S24 [Piscirickettsiaceae bacterium NZ-RLO2]ALA25713.1 cro/C1-type HTH DNA-binding domain protein [Piscirickettsia salmonis]APS43202.1 hypothetical protein AVI48_01600 [Piscirickettsia salmonis]APS46551.1 hypothetical protein AVI49_02200 [Piscirickettsia salmonis]APS50520.1 hypothetical protein AVI50_06440 [Piscirickettsia salmonis]